MSASAARRWPRTTAQAIALQRNLCGRIIQTDQLPKVEAVAGIDVGFEDGGATARAAVALLSLPGLELIHWAVAREPTRFPYIPGLLSFREVPVMLKALRKLAVPPDLVLCDGQGMAHPRGFGLACHLGLAADLPTVGVAKSRLIGTFTTPGPDAGDTQPLTHQGQQIGSVVRTRAGVAPLYISAGHRISLASAVAYTLACVTRYRLPQTTRWAHLLASVVR